MILVDTSVWADHFRVGVERLELLLDAGQVAVHPFVIGELALGHLRQRALVLDALHALPATPHPDHAEVMTFIGAAELTGRGIGLVDTYLLAAARLRPGTKLWTRDRKLAAVATAMGLVYAE